MLLELVSEYFGAVFCQKLSFDTSISNTLVGDRCRATCREILSDKPDALSDNQMEIVLGTTVGVWKCGSSFYHSKYALAPTFVSRGGRMRGKEDERELM